MTDETKAILAAIEEISKRVSAIEDRGGHGGERTVWEITQIMEAKQKLCGQLKAKHSFDAAMGTEWQDQDARKRYFEIRKEIKQLNEQLAGM